MHKFCLINKYNMQNDEFRNQKNFDLFTHLKSNLQNLEYNCNDRTKTKIYCFECRASSCSMCGISNHSGHQFVIKNKCILDEANVEKIFCEVEKELSDEMFSNISSFKQTLTDSVNKYIDRIINILEDVKNKKHKEIENIFKNFDRGLSDSIGEIKFSLCNYYKNNYEFFNLVDNADVENTVFLLNFELMNNCFQKNKEIRDLIMKAKNSYNNYDKDNKDKFEKIINSLNSMMEHKKPNQRNTVTEIDFKNSPADDFKNISNKLNTDFLKETKNKIMKFKDNIENFKKYVYDSYVKYGNSLKEIDRYVSLYLKKHDLQNKIVDKDKTVHVDEEKKIEMNKCKRISLVDYMNDNLLLKIDDIKYSERLAEEVKDFEQYENNEITAMSPEKKVVFQNVEVIKLNSMKRTSSSNLRKGSTGSVTDLHKVSNKRKSNLLDSPIKKSKRSSIKTKEKGFTLSTLIKEWSNLQIKSKHDINLNNKLLQVYFSLYTLEYLYKLIDPNTRQDTKSCSPQKPSLKSNFCQELELDSIDYAKPIEGTNEIHIYDKKNHKLSKKQIPLHKSIQGCSVFLDGARYILQDNILIIAGGRDEFNEYNIVLQYDVRENTITRTSDMNYPHSYHTIEYNKRINSILVIGGENNKICEVFEINSDKWHRIPDLIFGRANVQLYYDNIRSHLYSFFGQLGKITSNEYSDFIEVLDFNDMEKGWAKVVYENRSEMNLNYYCGIYPLFKDMILMIGGNQSRNNKLRSSSVYDVKKQELTKVDDGLLEELRAEARKSPRLSIILAKLTT